GEYCLVPRFHPRACGGKVDCLEGSEAPRWGGTKSCSPPSRARSDIQAQRRLRRFRFQTLPASSRLDSYSDATFSKFLILSQLPDSHAGRRTVTSLYGRDGRCCALAHIGAAARPSAWRRCSTAAEISEESRAKGW